MTTPLKIKSDVLHQLKAGRKPQARIYRDLGISKATFYRIKQQLIDSGMYEPEENIIDNVAPKAGYFRV